MASSLWGQANFALRNRYLSYGIDAPVFDAMGLPLEGPGFRAELWGAATPDALMPALDLGNNRTRLIVPYMTRGYFGSSAGFLSVPDDGAFRAWLQVRAWDASLGATYEEVAALGMGGYGESPLFFAQGGNPYDMLGVPAPLIGLESFSLRPVPEPSTWLLLGCGGLVAGCLARRRVKDSFNRRSL